MGQGREPSGDDPLAGRRQRARRRYRLTDQSCCKLDTREGSHAEKLLCCLFRARGGGWAGRKMALGDRKKPARLASLVVGGANQARAVDCCSLPPRPVGSPSPLSRASKKRDLSDTVLIVVFARQGTSACAKGPREDEQTARAKSSHAIDPALDSAVQPCTDNDDGERPPSTTLAGD